MDGKEKCLKEINERLKKKKWFQIPYREDNKITYPVNLNTTNKFRCYMNELVFNRNYAGKIYNNSNYCFIQLDFYLIEIIEDILKKYEIYKFYFWGISRINALSYFLL